MFKLEASVHEQQSEPTLFFVGVKSTLGQQGLTKAKLKAERPTPVKEHSPLFHPVVAFSSI